MTIASARAPSTAASRLAVGIPAVPMTTTSTVPSPRGCRSADMHIDNAGNGQGRRFVGRTGHTRLALPFQRVTTPQAYIGLLIRTFLCQPVGDIWSRPRCLQPG